MRQLYVTLTPIAVAAAMAGIWLTPPAPVMTRHGPIQPLAALAWAQFNCSTALAQRTAAAPLHADDLRRVGAHFDELRATAGDAAACHAARSVAASAAENGTPVYRTEVLVSVALPVR